ncbi:MAG: hypothetical protein NVSMB64_21990 [Candidatus Velthaea sp.]
MLVRERRKRKRDYLAPLLGFVVGLAFIVAVVMHIDIRDVGRALAAASPLNVFVAVVAALGGLTIRGFRWWLMLRATGSKVTFPLSLRIFFGSFGLNNVMPLRLGDVARVFGFTEELGSSPWAVMGTLLTERTLDMLVLIALSAIVIPLVPAGTLPPKLGHTLESVVVVAIVSLVCLFVFNRPIRAVLGSSRVRTAVSGLRAAEFVRGRVIDVLESTARSSTLGLLPVLLGLSIAGWASEGTVVIVVLSALGLPANAAAALLGFGCGTLGTMLPGPPGNFGTFDYLAVQGLIVGGIAATPATAVALLSHLVIWGPVTVIGCILLLMAPRERRHRIARLRATSLTDAEAPPHAG